MNFHFQFLKDGWPEWPTLETLFILLLFAISATYVVQMHLERTPDPRDDYRGSAILFLTYNVLAGAGLVEEAQWGPLNLTFYIAAIGLHLLFNDRYLRHLCRTIHTPRWRIPLAAAPVAGCTLVVLLDLPFGALYALLALVAGGTIINVLRRELPGLKRFRPLAFIVGVVGYTTLILATWRF